MDSRYLKGLKGEDREKLKAKLLTARDEFDYVRDILNDKVQGLREELESRDLATEDNWEVQVAALLAEIRALKSVEKLLNLDSNKE